MARPLKYRPVPTPLGLGLRRLREEAGLHREELGVAAGLRSMTILRIETGATPDPHWSTVVAIARVLDVDLEYLAGLGSEPSAA